MPIELRFVSSLAAPAERVWDTVKTMTGVNRELGPWVRMTVPRHLRRVPLDALPVGRPAFRSVLLAGGLLPFDVHALTLVEVKAGRFLERSHSWMQETWEHEREVRAVDGGARIEDRLRITPRVAALSALVRPIVASLFRWRHHRLRQRFGTLPLDVHGPSLHSPPRDGVRPD